MSATDKLDKLLVDFLELCRLDFFDGVILTGSMVFGRNHSVNEHSDIDIIFFTDSTKIKKLKKEPVFADIDINDDFIEAFALKKIDRFWLDYPLRGVNINIGIWRTE